MTPVHEGSTVSTVLLSSEKPGTNLEVVVFLAAQVASM